MVADRLNIQLLTSPTIGSRPALCGGSEEDGRGSELIYSRGAPDRRSVADVPGDFLG